MRPGLWRKSSASAACATASLSGVLPAGLKASIAVMMRLAAFGVGKRSRPMALVPGARAVGDQFDSAKAGHARQNFPHRRPHLVDAGNAAGAFAAIAPAVT